MTPLQVATVRAALAIVRGPEAPASADATDRRLPLGWVVLSRTAELEVIGEPTAIVPVMTGPERIGRRTAALSDAAGVLVNLVEFPAVSLGASRLRLQISPAHASVDLERCADAIAEARKLAEAS